jgi:hydroxycarboxylate dehydrogenase B
MPIVAADYLTDVAAHIFAHAGVPAEEARTVAKSLVTSNLMGMDSHGVIRVMQYLDLIEKGGLKPDGRFEIVIDAPAMVVAKGNWGFGMVVARQATELVIERAAQFGVAAVTVAECNHVGRVGEFTAMIADRNMMGLATANGHGAAQRVVPWGGIQHRLSTNPISFAVPSGHDHPIVVDMASSVTAEGKVRVARNKGKRLPEPWIVTAKGELSTDPNDLYGPPPGSLLPLGGYVGYKGYALSVMVDIMSGGLSAAGCSRGGDQRLGNGFYVQAIDIEKFIPEAEFASRMREFAAHLESSALAPGFTRIMLPGDPEYDTMAARQQDGIAIDDETWRQLSERATKLGVRV